MTDGEYSRYRQYYERLGPALKKPHVRAYTMAALSFLSLALFGAFAIRPAIKEIFELNRKISDRQVVSQKLDEKIKNLRSAEAEYKKIQADLPLILTALPQRADFPPFLKNLEATASTSAISLLSLKFQDIDLTATDPQKAATSAANTVSLRNYSFNLEAGGLYPDLVSLLKSLETGERIVNLGDLSLSSERRGTASAGLRTAINAQTYFSTTKIVTEGENER